MLTWIGVCLSPFCYLLLCLSLAATLAYPLVMAFPGFADAHFLVSRGGEILLVCGLIGVSYWLQLGRREIGLDLSRQGSLQRLLQGFGWGSLMLGMHVLLLLTLDVRHIQYDKLEWARILKMTGKALLIGISVATVEETIFRGVLLGALLRKMTVFPAVLLSAAYFAGLHFLSTDLRPEASEVHWYTGFMMIGDALGQLSTTKLDSFLALFNAGLLLACVRLLAPSSGLAYCIGLHAGWVFVIKTAKPFTKKTADSSLGHLVSGFDGIIGYLSAGWLSVLIFLLIVHLVRNNRLEAGLPK